MYQPRSEKHSHIYYIPYDCGEFFKILEDVLENIAYSSHDIELYYQISLCMKTLPTYMNVGVWECIFNEIRLILANIATHNFNICCYGVY